MKKLIAILLVVALTASVSVAGTMAYLQDEDSDVNVMTLGNVKIEQHEYERAEGESHINVGAQEGDLVPFVQGQPLYPAVPKADDAYEAEQDGANGFHWGDYVTAEGAWNGLWDDNNLANVMDKFVFVENTGKTDAYYRTLIALECPEGMTIGYASQGAEIETNVNGNSRFAWDYEVGYITIEGTRYEVWSVTYNDILVPGEVSRPSLLQVILTHHATNEDMELLGETYDILVLSQAVQTAGFSDAATALDTAFGKVAENAAEWFSDMETPVVVSSFEEMVEVCETGGHMILANDITYTAENTEMMIGGSIFLLNGKNVTLDLNGHDITIAEDATQVYGAIFFVGNPGGHIDIVGDGEITVKNGLATVVWTLQSGTANIYGGTYTSNSVSNEAMLYSQGNGGVIHVYGGKYTYDLDRHLNGGFNVSDQAGNNLRIVIHEGVLLSRPEYSQHLQGTTNGEQNRIQLEEGCTLKEVVIDGTTWYQVVKA